MTRIRIGETLFLIPDEQWEDSIRRGLIPPEAWIHSPLWTGGVWRLADSLEVYHLYLPTDRPPRRARPPGLRDTVFPRRGISSTEILVLLNILAMSILYLVWKENFQDELWWFSRFLRRFVGSGKGFFAVVIPVFLHVTPSHLLFNMLALLASGSVTEYFYGRWRMLIAYLVCGFGGAAMSMALRPKGVLSIGASGAIFGLYGLVLLFLLRHLHRFGPRQRWKTIRVYIPIVVLAVIPAIFGGDFYTHLGGFLTGCAIGLFLPPGPRFLHLTEQEASPDDGSGAGAGAP